MADSTRKKLLDAALETILATADAAWWLKGPATFISEFSARFGDLPDEQQAALADATPETIREALMQLDLATKHAAYAAAGVDRIEDRIRELHDAVQRSTRKPKALKRAKHASERLHRELIDFSSERDRHESFFGRTDVLARVDDWLTDTQFPSGWMLLTGGPGMGKSAILAHYLGQLKKAGPSPVPHFFLRRGVEDWDRPDVVRRTLAAQIEAIYPDQTDAGTAPESRLRELLTRISKKMLVPRRQRLILVVDGLDESAVDDARENPLPRFLPHALPHGVFVLCASRPTYPHLSWLESRDGVHRIDLDASEWADSNGQACRACWQNWAEQFTPPLDEDFIRAAVDRGEGNILHAVKLREYLTDAPPQKRRVELIPRGLSGFMDQIWQRLHELPDELVANVMDGLGLLCAAREALPLSVLEGLLGWPGEPARDRFLRATRPFLLEQPAHWEGVIAYRPFHESFREFVAAKLEPDRMRQLHRLLADGLAAWPCIDEEGSFRHRYALRHAVAHRLHARQWDRAGRLCADVGFLEAKCRDLGVASIEGDLESAAARIPRESGRESVAAIHRTVRAESHWLHKDPRAIGGLLYNRLLSVEDWPAGRIQRSLTFPKGLPVPRLRHPVQLGGQEERVLIGHSGEVYTCCVTPDGKWAVSGGFDKTLKVWDLRSGRALLTLTGHEGHVNSCCVTPDGKWVVSASDDKTLKVWDLESGRALKSLTGHEGDVNSCCVTPDGKWVVSASDDKTLKVWDLESGRELKMLAGHEGGVLACCVTPDGKRVVSASFDGMLKVWNLESGQELKTLTVHEGGVLACCVTPDGKRVVSASHDSTLKVWDLGSGRELKMLAGHKGGVRACCVTPDGKRVVSASFDGMLKVWNLESGRELKTLTGHEGGVLACCVTPDGKCVVSASHDQTLKIWNLDGGRVLKTLTGHDDLVHACCVTPDAKRVVSASDDSTLKVWDLQSGRRVKTLAGHKGGVYACCVTPDAKLVVSASDDETLKVWNLRTGRALKTLTGHKGSVRACCVTPDGKLVVSASDDKTLKVWNLESGRAFKTLTGHKGRVRACCVTPDGKRVVSASDDFTLKVWNLESGRALKTLTGHYWIVRACCVTPDGKLAVSASSDFTLNVWDLASGHALKELTEHDWKVWSCCVTPDGKRVVSASEDKTLKVWDLQSGEVLATVYGTASFRGVSTSRRVICAGDGLGNVWILEYGEGRRTEPSEKTAPRAVRVFYSYSHKDEALRDALETHLALMKRQNVIETWHDRKTTAGQEWRDKIDEHLTQADVILLLISADFLASDYCYDLEMKRALERHDSGDARVIPIMVRPCDWKSSPFAKLQALPRDAKPVTLWDNTDKAWLDVANGIRRTVEQISSR